MRMAICLLALTALKYVGDLNIGIIIMAIGAFVACVIQDYLSITNSIHSDP